MDAMINAIAKPASKLPRALLAAALLALPVSVLPPPAAAEDTPRSEAEGRDKVEQRLKAAQERMEQAAREMAELSLSLDGEKGTIDSRIKLIMVKRPMLGMTIDKTADGAGAGVRVVSVSPGGPADSAGLRANDVVISLNGKALRGDAQHSAPEQLHAIMKAVKSGESVAIEYQRDGKSHKAQIVPKDMPGMHEDLDLPSLPNVLALEGHEDGPMTRVMRLGFHDSSGFGAAEMVDLSPALGSYFGTDKGLLVVRAPKDQRLKLQDGDVLIDVDGRVPGSVAHALQILASYRSGETVHLHILRQKQRVELSVEVPEA